jgi:hypothetical protein
VRRCAAGVQRCDDPDWSGHDQDSDDLPAAASGRDGPARVVFSLKVKALFMVSFDMGGRAHSLAATLLVWLGGLISEILISIHVFKQLREESRVTSGPNVNIR